jgi:formylglycine-generating enzyme required for sulfatase activity
VLAAACLALSSFRAAHAQEGALYLPAISRPPALGQPFPPDQAAGQSPNVFLAWQPAGSAPPNPRYSVFLEAGDDSPDTLAADALVRPSFDPPTLALDTTYYWQVVVTGADGHAHQGPVWSFGTERLEPQPDVTAMVLVPAGEFTLGCDTAQPGGDAADPGVRYACRGWEQPLRTIWLDAYAIDKYEVTNGEYRACVAAGACGAPRSRSSHKRAHYYDDSAYNLYPVLFVSRQNAIDFCMWEGKRLPTEAQWEKAARGPIDTRPFPWGSEDTDCTRQHRPDLALCGSAGFLDTAQVGLYPRGATPYGAYDMSGNVFEWTYDRFEEEWYRNAPYANPVNPPTDAEDLLVIRGGSYRDNLFYLTTYHRHIAHHGDFPGDDRPLYRSDRLGFRCVQATP